MKQIKPYLWFANHTADKIGVECFLSSLSITGKIDWLALEDITHIILDSTHMTHEEKLEMIAYSLNKFTGR